MSDLEALLREALWARQLSGDELARVRADVFERSFAAGGYVCRKGERPEHWHGVVDGLLKMCTVSPAGKAATFTGLPSGAWFGEGTLLKDEPRKYDLIALRDSRIAHLPRATFQWLLARSIPFNRFLLDQLNERLGQFIAMCEIDRLLEPDARVARCLATMFHPLLYPGHGRTLKISQEEIGNLAGVSRQRVNQALQQLERERLVTIEYGGIRVDDLDRLRQYGA